ncbi:MAG TPA: acetyl-CoA hydrolase/transferase C-terminal domain-containing protein [Kribbella sp.]|nr:acetyl-CoA hydrolase/transferase C-terminal domain-containing protein [Kribbella sp.]
MKLLSDQGLFDVLSALPGRPRVVSGGNHGTPTALLAALDRAIPEYRLFMLNAGSAVPDRDGVTLETCFVGAGMRGSRRLAYIPSRLSLLPVLFRTTLPPDAVVVQTTAPRNGVVSLGVEVNVLPSAIEACRARGGVVIAQLNPRMPYTFGDSQLALDEIDFAIEVEEPLAEHHARPPDDISAGIGERVASLVPNGATLQLGIGAVPDATLAALTGRQGLRIWSEMFSDGLLALDRAGVLDPDRVITASFCFGSPELYEWLDGNTRVRMLRTEKTNDPALIARQPAMTSVNTALQVDLFAQVNASRIGHRVWSGFGGQTDFIVGALHAIDGRALIALRSWHDKTGSSTVVPLLDEPVTSFQPTAIVTENGVASLLGHDERAQARHLIDHAAHPKIREELQGAAVRLGLA